MADDPASSSRIGPEDKDELTRGTELQIVSDDEAGPSSTPGPAEVTPLDRTIIPTPFGRTSEELTESNIQIPGRLSINPSGKLLIDYLTYRTSPVNDLIRGYDHWIRYEITTQIGAQSLEFIHPDHGEVFVKYEDLNLVTPSYTIEGQQRRLFPENARRLGLSYMATLTAHPKMYGYKDGKAVLLQVADSPQEIARIPVMLKSDVCHLNRITDPEELISLGEDPRDPFGYFIINGREMMIINSEKMRINRIYVDPGTTTKEKRPVCSLIVSTPTGTRQMKIMVSEKRSLQLYINAFRRENEKQKANTINILHIVEIMDYFFLSDNNGNRLISRISQQINARKAEKFREPGVIPYFKQIVLSLIKPERHAKVSAAFAVTEAEYSVVPFASAYAKILTFMGMAQAPEADQVRKIREIFTEQFFPNITRTRPGDKIMMLSIMTARLLEFIAGFTKPDNKDSWANKKLDGPGPALSQSFRGLWSKAIIEAQRNINSTTTAQGNKRITIKFPQAINNLKPDIISDGLISFFNPNSHSGVNQSYAQRSVVDDVKRHNLVDLISQLLKIDVPTLNRNSKSAILRAVLPTQWEYICPLQTPEREACGIVKFRAITSSVTVGVDPNPYFIILKNEGYISEGTTDSKRDIILVNGEYRGWCNANATYKYCVSKRRDQTFHPYSEFVNTGNGYFEVYTDAGRLVRPLAVVGKSGGMLLDEENVRDKGFEYLLRNGYIEYIGAAESEWLNIAMSIEGLKARKQEINEAEADIQYAEAELARYDASASNPDFEPDLALRQTLVEKVDQVKKDFQRLNVPYEYCSIHPVAMFGMASAVQVYTNYGAAPRGSYQAKMYKQALSIAPVNPYRHSTSIKAQLAPTQPLVRSALDDVYGLSTHPLGRTVTIAMASYSGFNQEDAFVFNRASLELGLFRYIYYSKYITVVQNVPSCFTEKLARPAPRGGEDPAVYKYINDNGLPSIGAPLRQGDCVIGKIRTPNDPTKPSMNRSVFISVGEYGIVDDVRVINDGKGLKVSVRVKSVRQPQIGDKFAVRYAQKGTIGHIRDKEDMPFDSRGDSPDVIMNPHAVPSRMTMGMIREILLGTSLALEGKVYNDLPFDTPVSTERIEKTLLNHGFESKGEVQYRDGVTGQIINTRLFTGQVYLQQLHHMAAQKIQARGRGSVNDMKQAPQGKSNRGGVRFGHMETSTLIGHGASAFLQERTCALSDSYTTVYCAGCGYIATYDAYRQEYICKTCDTEARFGIVEIAYIYKMITQVLASVGMAMRSGLITDEEKLERMETSARTGELTIEVGEPQDSEEDSEEDVGVTQSQEEGLDYNDYF